MDATVNSKTPRRRAAFAFVFATVLLDMVSLGIVIPVLPKLVTEFMGGDTGQAAEIFGLFATGWALMQFLFSPLQGVLSDRFGRRAIILISNFGAGIDYVVMALAPTIGWLFFGRIVSGITSGSIATAYAYIADVTPPEQRGARFGLLGAAFGAGFVLGPALGGLAGNFSLRLPFWIAAGLSLANTAYGLFVLPESLSRAQRSAFSWRRANPLGALTLLRRYRELFGLAGVNFLGNLAHEVLPSVSVLYMAYRYGFDERVVGLTLAGVGAAAIVVQGAIVGRVIAWIGERATLLIGFAFGVVGFVVFAIATNGLVFWAGIPIMALWGLASPAAMALMSGMVGESEQGQLQGANASITGIAHLIGPSLFTLTFAYAIGAGRNWDQPGAPFLIAALLLALAMVFAWLVTAQPRAITPAR